MRRTAKKTLAATVAVVLLALSGKFVLLRVKEPEIPDEAPQATPRNAPRPLGNDIPDTGNWNTYHGDAALRGVADASFPDTLDVWWRFMAGGPVRQTPVAEGGRIFAATAHGVVHALDMHGGLLWSRAIQTEATPEQPARDAEIESPIACFGGSVLAGTYEGLVVCLDAESGAERWRAHVESGLLGAINYAGAGDRARVFVLEQPTGAPVCLDAATGAVVWRGEEVGRSDASPAVNARVLVFGSCAAALHAFDPETGKKLRDLEIDPDSQVAGGVALLDTRVVSGCRRGKVFEADWESGAFLWTNTDSGGEVFTTPAVTDAWVIACSYDGFIYGLDRVSGMARWKYETQGLPSSAVVAGDKVIVSVDGELAMFRLATGEKVFSYHVSDLITSPAVTQRRILVGSEDGTVVAFGAVSP
ncbi:MAG: PQQ-binding-like beta-propeller repeat protein [Candidatus Hydrogenedentes bacterium]|nr:PQQ-binding-like beta-propeller repeat protein [Candidatus Hydrogenedentota bacterium]